MVIADQDQAGEESRRIAEPPRSASDETRKFTKYNTFFQTTTTYKIATLNVQSMYQAGKFNIQEMAG